MNETNRRTEGDLLARYSPIGIAAVRAAALMARADGA